MKKILGMPLAVFIIGLMVIGGASALLLTDYVRSTATTTTKQSVTYTDDTTSKTYSFDGSIYAGNTFYDEFLLENHGNVPAPVELNTVCTDDCSGISWRYISTPEVIDDGNGGFGDSQTIAYHIDTNGETLDEIFSGKGFSYTYEVVNGGTYNGAASVVAVFELDNGNHVILFPGWGDRTGEHSLTFNETIATATSDSGDVVADFGLYDSEFVGIDTNTPYQDWADTRDNDDYSVDGTEQVVDAYFMNQGAGTNQEDIILKYVYNQQETSFKKVSDWNNFVLEPGEIFWYESEFNFDVALAPGTYNIETTVSPQ